MDERLRWQSSERVPSGASPRHEVALTVLDVEDVEFLTVELASRGVYLVTTGQVLRYCLRQVARQVAHTISYVPTEGGDL